MALVSGLVLASAATARRTASAFPRFKAAHGYDAFLFTVTPKPKIATPPEVASATPVGAVGIGTPTCACSRPIASSDVAVFEVAPKDLPHVVKLVAGRMPDPSDPHQVLASFSLQQDAGLHIGTVIRVPLYAASQRAALLSGVSLKPRGPTLNLRVVGFEAADGEFPGTGPPDHNVYTTPAFARTVNPKTVVLASYLVRLRHGSADLPRFEAHARALRSGGHRRPGRPDHRGHVLDPSPGHGVVDPGRPGRAGRDHRRGPGPRPPGRHRVRALRQAERAGRLATPAGRPDHDHRPC